MPITIRDGSEPKPNRYEPIRYSFEVVTTVDFETHTHSHDGSGYDVTIPAASLVRSPFGLFE